MSEPTAAVTCRGLTKRFGAVTALDGLDLSIPAGSIFGLLGPNGAGKTTTLRILTSLATATAGEAAVAGLAVGGGEANRRGLIGYLDQDPRFHGWMTGGELLELVGQLHGLHGAELRTRIDESLELAGLTDAGRRTIGGYSGGMRQRLGLAQAVLNRPPVLLLDEPVSNLDPEGRRDILLTIRGLAAGSTVVLSTHILADVERVCDRVGILDHGKLVIDAPIDDLLEQYAQPVYQLEAERGAEQALARLGATIGRVAWVTGIDASREGILRVAVTDAADAGRQLMAAAVAGDVPLASFERQRPTLEDVFLQLVSDARA